MRMVDPWWIKTDSSRWSKTEMRILKKKKLAKDLVDMRTWNPCWDLFFAPKHYHGYQWWMDSSEDSSRPEYSQHFLLPGPQSLQQRSHEAKSVGWVSSPHRRRSLLLGCFHMKSGGPWILLPGWTADVRLDPSLCQRPWSMATDHRERERTERPGDAGSQGKAWTVPTLSCRILGAQAGLVCRPGVL